MEKQFYVFLFFLTALIHPYFAEGDTYIAVQDGKWESTDTWTPNGVPGAGDIVIIKGYEVVIDDVTGDVAISNLMLDNSGASNGTMLTVSGSVTLNIANHLEGYLDNTYESVRLKLMDNAAVDVAGNVVFERKSSNYNTNRLEIQIINDATLNVTGNFNYNYNQGNILEFLHEIYLKNEGSLIVGQDMNLGVAGGNALVLETFDSSKIQIIGDMNLVQTGGIWLSVRSSEQSEITVGGNINAVNNGGADLKIRVDDTGKIGVTGNVNMNSQNANSIITLKARNSGIVDVDGDLTMDANSQSDVFIGLYNNSEFKMGGDFLRPSDYGRLDMDDGASLIMDGTTAQVVPAEDFDGNGTDAFNISNIEFNNSAGFTLEDTMVVTRNLSLDAGIIVTDVNRPIIIADGATSDMGSANAYVDGPMIKQGSTNGGSFTFPLGNKGVYAPLEISEVTSSEDQFMASYAKDPPPIEEGKNGTLSNMSHQEYWTLSRIAGSTPVTVTLYWEDAAASGISNPSNLVVAYSLNSSSPWESIGNGGLSVNGSSGSLASADPPPIEDSKFTFGSGAVGGSALPVELMSFNATEEGSEVLLEWETSSEVNASYFMVEKSRDGTTFEPVSREDATGVATRSYQYYETLDEHPYTGLNYYRLKMVDLDGTYSYSDLKVVEIKVTAEAVLFPNPVFDILYVRYGEESNEKVLIEVYNQQGQLLYRGYEIMMDSEIMMSAQKMNISVPGTYILNIHGSGGSQSLRFVKGH